MKFHQFAIVFVASMLCHDLVCADPAIEPLQGFEVGLASNGPALRPRAALYLHTDRNFHGTTPDGGAFGMGTFFRLSQSGMIGSQSFSGHDLNQPGSAPACTPVLASDGWLWGTTTTGGTLAGAIEGGLGSVFRMRPETGEFQTMHTFDSYGGNSPASSLVSDGQGYLWGTNQYNNNSNTSNGSIFRIHELTGVAENLLTFGNTVAPKGRVPQGALYFDGAGNLWGTTTSGGLYGNGTIFKYIISSNTLVTVAEFSGGSTPVAGAIKGSDARSGLVSDGNGFLWGAALTGGTLGGTIFKVEMATNTATSVLEFSNNGASNKGLSPVGPLVNDGAGFLWGVAGSGANSDKGSVFKIAHSTGALTTVLEFGSLTGGNVNVRHPLNGLSTDGQGYLWGIASSYYAIAPTAVYKIKIADGSFTKVAEHPIGGVSYKGRTPLAGLVGNATTPWLWGTTSQGGTHNLGTLFRFNPTTGQRNVLIHFTGQTGTAPGSKPNGRVFLDASGLVWGTTELGGSGNNGSIFKYNPATGIFTSVYSFVADSGFQPRAGLVDGGDGFLWGTASDSPNGAIFKLNPTTGAYTTPYLFSANSAAEGATPEGELLRDGVGNLWGTARFGGSGDGVLFKFTPATSTYTAVVKFTGVSGSFYGKNPSGPLVIDASGNLWGTASSPDLSVSSVFKYVPGTATFTNVFFGENNNYPLKSAFVGTLSKATSGNIRFLGTETTKDFEFYDSPRAVIYEINPSSNAVTKVRSLVEGVLGGSATTDFVPAGGLYDHTDGQLYGLTTQGGTDMKLKPAGGGMIYRVRTGPAAMTQPYSTTSEVFNTLSTTSLATHKLTLRGVVNPNGNAMTCTFEWGPTTALGNTLAATRSHGTGTGYTTSIYTATLSGLPSNRAFFYRIRVNSSGAASYGPIRSVQTRTPTGTFLNQEIAVESPLGQDLTDNVTTVNFGSHLAGRAYKQQVAVRNLGQGDLSGLTAVITGTNVGDFVITKPLSLTTLSGTPTSAGLLITFTPGSGGLRQAMLTITSNDENEGSFEIPLSGMGLIQPEIEVDSPSFHAMQSDEGSYDFGTGATNAAMVRSFTIRNTGNAPLSGLAVTSDGINSSDFVVTSQPPASITAGSSGTFTVTFTPSFAGNRSAVMQVASSDSDENPFIIPVSGTGIIAPEIEVQADSVVLIDGVSSIAFGNVGTGTSTSKVVTIRNLGSSPLTDVSLSIAGTNTTDFSAATVPSSVAAGGQTTFLLGFAPQAAGARTAILRIASSDSDENPFDIVLNGTGTAPTTAIESWRQTWFGMTSNTGAAADSADPDGDGHTNLMEFALAMNPTLSTTPIIQATLVGTNIEFTYTRSKAAVAAALDYQVPWTETLASSSWHYSDTIQQILSDNGTIQTVKATIPAGSGGSRFVRLEVR